MANPSWDRLAAALLEEGLSEMARRARQGHYSDFASPLETPKMTLVGELLAHGNRRLSKLAERVKVGEFDG